MTPYDAILAANPPLLKVEFTNRGYLGVALYEHVILSTKDKTSIEIVGYAPGKRFTLEGIFKAKNHHGRIDRHDNDYLSIVLVNTDYPPTAINLADPDSLDLLDDLWNNPPRSPSSRSSTKRDSTPAAGGTTAASSST